MTNADNQLYYVETIQHRGHAIKLVRIGARMKAMIYPPGAILATRAIEDTLSNYEATIDAAKTLIDQLIAQQQPTES